MNTLPKNIVTFLICPHLDHNSVFNLSVTCRQMGFLREDLTKLDLNEIKNTNSVYVLRSAIRQSLIPLTDGSFLMHLASQAITISPSPELVCFIVDNYFPGLLTIKHLNNLFTAAATKNDYDLVNYFLERGAEKLDIGLAMGAKNNNFEMVSQMIELGATEVNWAMAMAAQSGHKDMLKYLIKYHNAQNFDQAMAMAAYANEQQIMQMMINLGARNYDWALASAAIAGNENIVDWVIALGARNYEWGLKSACYGGSLSIVKKIIELSDNVDLPIRQAMNWASAAGHSHILNYLRYLVDDDPPDRF